MNLDDLRMLVSDHGPGSHYAAEVRNDLIEALHRVHIAVVNKDGDLLYSSGDPNMITYSRSCIKPIQALPVLIHGAADYYALTEKEIALISGSHSGQREHLETVRSILKKAGLDETMLKCRGHVPFDKKTAKEIGQDFSSLHDNCSGKHAGALLLCSYMGWDMENYLSVDHPLQEEIIAVISTMTGLKKRNLHMGIDGCDIPNHALPLKEMARMFAMLHDAGGNANKISIEKVGRSMMEHPFMVAGRERFDTVIMEDNKGRIISKAGAAGLQTISIRTGEGALGISIKVEDGAYSVIPPLAYSVLNEMGADVLRSARGEEYARGVVKTRSKMKVGNTIVMGELQKER